MKFPAIRVAVVAAICFSTSLGPGPIAQEAFVDRVDVNVVNVEVFVTDKDGRHVGGLTAEDFTLFQDGRQVPITNFYSVAGAVRPTPPDEAPEPATVAPAPPSAEREKPVVPAEQQLRLVVYVDNFNIRAGNRKQVLKDLRVVLQERAASGDQIMLLTYNRAVTKVRSFTNDWSELSAGLDEIDEMTANGMKEQTRFQIAARRIATAVTAVEARTALERYATETSANILFSTRAFESVVRSMGGLPGRKAVLYVSDGLPFGRVRRLVAQFWGEQSSGPLGGDTSFDAIAHQANANQVTLYTLDARGPESVGMTVNAGVSGEVSGATSESNSRVSLDAVENLSIQGPLIELADATGGTAIINTGNFDDAVASVAEDFDSYYSLGFEALTPGDGKLHKLDVKVQRPGLKVRHRDGFLDKPLIEQTADRTLASLIVGLDKNPLGLQLQFAPPEKKGSKRYLLPILLQIPIRELTLLPAGEDLKGRLRIFVAAQDEEGGVSPLRDIPFPVSIPKAEMAASRDDTVAFTTQLEIRPGSHEIAIGVFDEGSGAESFVSKTVPVGKVKKKKKKKRSK